MLGGVGEEAGAGAIPAVRLALKVVAKLEFKIVEVKRSQSLEVCMTPSLSFAVDPSDMTCRTDSRKRRTIAVLTAAALSTLGLACGDFTGVPASLPTISDTGTVFALNGAPAGAPSGLHVFTGTLVPVDQSFSFDVGFDIDTSGGIIVYPQRTVATALSTTTHSVGLQTVRDTFEAVLSAPKSGYRADTALVTSRNVVVLVQSNDAGVCGLALTGTSMYAKFQITEVNRLTRQLKIRWTVDPNCGFVSFQSGVPKN